MAATTETPNLVLHDTGFHQIRGWLGCSSSRHDRMSCLTTGTRPITSCSKADQSSSGAGMFALRHHGSMRELIYLSERKLQQFIIDKSPSWLSRARVEGDIRIPGIGGVKIRPADANRNKGAGSNLDKVIAELESSSRAAQWFTDEESQPGQWVYFEAPQSYITIDESVIFLDFGKSTESYPTGNFARLMLHGSRIHLTDSAPIEPTRAKMYLIEGSQYRIMIGNLKRYLATEAEFDDPAPKGKFRSPDFSRIIAILDRALDLEHTSAWMAGHARITAIQPLSSGARLVIATPLYVEYIAQPRHID
jgi:hypothetical protein